jgi:hypothetical protein
LDASFFFLQQQVQAQRPVLKLRRPALSEVLETPVLEVAIMGEGEVLPNPFGTDTSGCNPRGWKEAGFRVLLNEIGKDHLRGSRRLIW